MSITHQSNRDANATNPHVRSAWKDRSRNNLRRFYIARFGRNAAEKGGEKTTWVHYLEPTLQQRKSV
jgi:hypothetical protein